MASSIKTFARRGLLPLTLASVTLYGVAGPASGAIDTTTRGRVCRNEPCHVETFSGGYFFEGTTRPSQVGQKVWFSYKRAGTHVRWHQFGEPQDSRKVFISVDGSRSFDRITRDNHWREHFDINGFTGYPHRHWILRAVFPRQDGFARSVEWVRVRAAYGD